MAYRFTATLSAAALISTGALAQQPNPAQMQAMMQAQMQQQMRLMAVMFDVRPARQGFDETVQAIEAGASKHGWPVGEVQDVQAKMLQAGVKDAKPIKVIPTCPPQANERLAKASGGKLPPLPCRITVFQGKDNRTMVVRMNTGNMAKLVKDPAVSKAMAEIGAEEDAVFKGIVQ